jgi:VanZ family protein
MLISTKKIPATLSLHGTFNPRRRPRPLPVFVDWFRQVRLIMRCPLWEKSSLDRTRSILIYHVPVVLYAGGVLALSSIPHLGPPPLRLPAADKIAHFIEYGIFAWLIFRSFSNIGRLYSAGRLLLFTVLSVSVFALFDEFYQRHVPGRHFDMADVASDAAGAVAVLLLIWLRIRRRKPEGRGH